MKLVEKSVNKSYTGTSNLNFNAIKADFKPGTYEFIVTTGKINPTESYLFVDVETSAVHTGTVKKNDQILKGVIPFFQFIN